MGTTRSRADVGGYTLSVPPPRAGRLLFLASRSVARILIRLYRILIRLNRILIRLCVRAGNTPLSRLHRPALVLAADIAYSPALSLFISGRADVSGMLREAEPRRPTGACKTALIGRALGVSYVRADDVVKSHAFWMDLDRAPEGFDSYIIKHDPCQIRKSRAVTAQS